MRFRVWSLVLPLALMLALVPVCARAQQRDPAAAQALFDEALALMKQGNHAAACPKLTESQRLDPGVGTQFHLADCFEKIGRTASAWVLFLEVESVAKASSQPDRERVASLRAKRLEARLPRLKIEVPPGRNVPGLEVVRDGMAVGSVQWGTPIPVDPGRHEIVSSAPGRRSVALEVEAGEGETVTFEVPELTLRRVTSEREPPLESAPLSEPDGPDDPPMGWIIGLGGVGVVGLGVGGAFALMARAEYEESKAECLPTDPNRCSVQGVQVRNGAIRKGNVATIAIVAGGAALAGAGVVFLVTRSSSKPEARELVGTFALAPGLALVNVGGKF